MTDNNSASTTRITTTFRFASGQVLSLDEDQIAKIPYLAAMVSSADRFESARDEDGHYKLDPHINYQHFSFILKSLSFRSVRQLFTHLPIKNDVIPIIALLDFLGLRPQSDPDLNEIDSTFFSTVVYSPLLERDIRLIRLCNIQDMAVRFGIAMAKEEYDFTKCEVLDQIYWFVMFILSAQKWFGPRLRHHVYIIVEHIFTLFKPLLLKPLNTLNHRSKKEARKFHLTTEEEDFDSDEENNSSLTQTFELNPDYDPWSEELSFFWHRERILEERQNLLLHRIYKHEYNDWRWYWRTLRDDDLLEPVYNRTLEIMYEQLQYLICQSAIAELSQKTIPHDFAQRRFYSPLSCHLSEPRVLPKRIDNVLKHELVQEAIRVLILEELCILIPKLGQRYAELVKEIQEFKQDSEISSENLYYLPIFFSSGNRKFETMQEEALSHELLLEKLDQDANTIVRQIERRVLGRLYEIALKQFNKWGRTRLYIERLVSQLNSCEESGKSHWITLKTMCQEHQISVHQHYQMPVHQQYQKPVHQQYQIPVHKPLLKRQFKYSTR